MRSLLDANGHARLGVFETTPEQVEAFCEGARELVRHHPYMQRDNYQIFLNEFGESGIQILVYVFWNTPDWSTELRERHRRRCSQNQCHWCRCRPPKSRRSGESPMRRYCDSRFPRWRYSR